MCYHLFQPNFYSIDLVLSLTNLLCFDIPLLYYYINLRYINSILIQYSILVKLMLIL